MKAIYGRKIGMTRIYTAEGESVAATVIETQPNVVFQVKTDEKEGYNAVQIGIGSQKPQRLTRARARHVAKAEKGTPSELVEIRQSDRNGWMKDQSFKVGDEVRIGGMFEVGSRVDVVGTSIGKGFQGVMKRHNMKGFINSHGTHEYFRHGGSIGNRKFPGRVFKNKRMPGQMGVDRVTQLGLEVISIRPEDNVLIIKGSIPGPKNGTVFVRQAVKG